VAIDTCPSIRRPTLSDDEKVTVQYLGVSGFLIRRGDDVVLTAPLYSNPSLVEVVANHTIRPDTDLIDRLLPPEASEAKAILVGHSHYDHLMDVPHVALQTAIEADIYGSTTTENLLAPIAGQLGRRMAPVRVVALDGVAGDHLAPGEWVPIGPGIRIMALRSEHSPQVTLEILSHEMPIHLWRGRQDRPRQELPRTASDWPEGPTFAFVIDFLDQDGEPVFRTYYQDSGASEPLGFVPPGMTAAKGVDLAIICVGGDFENLRNHPKGILENTRPRFVLLSHWEDFFVTQDAHDMNGEVFEIPLASERKTPKFRKLVRQALGKDAQEWLPCPTRSVFEFSIQ
jgi:hypothetical protein